MSQAAKRRRREEKIVHKPLSSRQRAKLYGMASDELQSLPLGSDKRAMDANALARKAEKNRERKVRERRKVEAEERGVLDKLLNKQETRASRAAAEAELKAAAGEPIERPRAPPMRVAERLIDNVSRDHTILLFGSAPAAANDREPLLLPRTPVLAVADVPSRATEPTPRRLCDVCKSAPRRFGEPRTNRSLCSSTCQQQLAKS